MADQEKQVIIYKVEPTVTEGLDPSNDPELNNPIHISHDNAEVVFLNALVQQ